MADSKKALLEELNSFMTRGDGIYRNTHDSLGVLMCSGSLFSGWVSDILSVLSFYKLDNTEYYKFISKQKLVGSIFPSVVASVIEQLKGLACQIEKGFIVLKQNERRSSLADLENIFNKFARVARQLRCRHSNRDTLTISDEYDVQDLLHALLILHYDDVRDEEWTPSYAGGCERMDFLLKDFETVIEVKKTRPSMSKKELGEELIIDIEKYKVHPGCKQLYCFVYDPDGYLGNSISIKNDLEKTHEGFVKVFIRPEV